MRFFKPIKHLFTLSFIVTISVMPTAWAQNTTSSIHQIESVKEASTIKPLLSISMLSINYSSSAPVDEKSQGQAEFLVGLKKTGFFFSEVQIIVGSFSGIKTAYATMPLAYVAVGALNKNYLAAGIKTQKLSFIDDYYHFGLYQSYLTNDFINYKDQGFIGLQAQLRSDFFGVKAGWQPYFFPNQGPESQVREENTQIVTSNRWAKQPPKRLEVLGETRNIEYVIRDYQVKDIISHQGETFSVFAGPDSDRPWVQASYARKPLNDIPLTRESFASTNNLIGHANVSPVVTYDEVRSVDFNLDRGIFSSTLSYLEDQPLNTDALPGETLQNISPMKIYGLFVSMQLDSLFARRFELSVAGAHVMGGDINDVAAEGEESILTFPTQRSQFKDPVTLGISTDLTYLYEQPLMSSVRWTYDRTFKGSLVSAQLAYETKAHLRLMGGFDVLGLENEPAPDAPTNYLSQNQANDRFFAGIGYVF